MIKIHSCPKGYVTDLDKTCSPEETVARAREALAGQGERILAQTRRIDTGRLGIPVFMSICGEAAREIMPTRKQMGKGASPAQAEASALMELVERFSFFSFWNAPGNFRTMTWTRAEEAFGENLLPIDHVIRSVSDGVTTEQARRILDLVPWNFAPVTDIGAGREFMAPLDWFKKLNEFNGSSAGNTLEESMLQGGCELVERHVCAVVDRSRQETPTHRSSLLHGRRYSSNCTRSSPATASRSGSRISALALPVPTVAALVMDPSHLPGKKRDRVHRRHGFISRKGGHSRPDGNRPARRRLRVVQQLRGLGPAQIHAPGPVPLADDQGPVVSIHDLPSNQDADITTELRQFLRAPRGTGLHASSPWTPRCRSLGIPANYNFIPGFLFRERTPMASLGLFVGRILAEDMDPDHADAKALDVLGEIRPDAHYLPFFRGLVALRRGDIDSAAAWFARAEPLQPEADDRGLAAFYQAYALSQQGRVGRNHPPPGPGRGTLPRSERVLQPARRGLLQTTAVPGRGGQLRAGPGPR